MEPSARVLDGRRTDVAGDARAFEALRSDHRGPRPAERIEDDPGLAARGAHDALEELEGLLGRIASGFGAKRRVGHHRGAIAPDAPERPSLVGVISIGP